CKESRRMAVFPCGHIQSPRSTNVLLVRIPREADTSPIGAFQLSRLLDFELRLPFADQAIQLGCLCLLPGEGSRAHKNSQEQGDTNHSSHRDLNLLNLGSRIGSNRSYAFCTRSW